MLTGLSMAVSQEQFAAVVGISQPRVAQLVAEGVLPRDGTAGQWLLAYCERLREQAAGRGQELTIERAALARSQRIGQDIKNAVAQGEFAAIGLLADVLAEASAAVAARFDSLAAQLQRRFPQLDESDRTQLMAMVAAARNAWAEETEALAVKRLDELAQEADDEPPAPDLGDDEDELTP
jgi:phage terminase Nu1 subunit (DNA packaging protein)